MYPAGSRRKNVAMHKSHCCHAQSRLTKGFGAAYLPVVPKSEREKDERRTTMNLIRNYRNWRRYRDTVSELSRLSNRELNDLGISRADIPFVARKQA
jgi:uncharacterized protein YjiS (DUF1127 family)